MAALGRAAVDHQADARPHHTGADARICASVVWTKIKSIRASYLIAMLIISGHKAGPAPVSFAPIASFTALFL
ncbi:hypothetical protein [Halomonas cupida]|uniref:hypothetical protein n=1 Tax=Halomonas cupida TaxID=44933 RepID=UPI003A8FBA1C